MIKDFTNSKVIHMSDGNTFSIAIDIEEYVNDMLSDDTTYDTSYHYFYIISKDAENNSYLVTDKNYKLSEDSISFTGYGKSKNCTYKLTDYLVIDSRNIDKLVRNYKLKKLDV